VIPDRDEQRKKNPVKRDKFSGAVLLMNEERDSFEVGWRYKNGKVTDIFYPTSKSANGRLSAYMCKIGFYQLMAQNPNANSGGYNCTPSHNQPCLPSSFLDAQTGGFWVLTGTFDATCDDGIPNGAPIRENPWDDDASWVVADPSGGGGGGGPVIRDPFDPINPTPIDYGMPMDLDPADAFAWELANRIGPDIYLTWEEIELIRSNYWLTYEIRNYIVANDHKPDILVLLDTYLQNHYAFITSPAERTILASRSWTDQAAFRINAINAFLEAMARFTAIGCQDNACNAYRHAFFNVLNAQSFMVSVARQLGQAREGNLMIDPETLIPINFVCDPLNPSITANFIDLFNNE
jgi:hypothetical protein